MAVNIRNLTKEEIQRWTQGIHRLASDDWVPVLRAAYSHLMPFVDEDCDTAYTDCHFRIGLGPHLLDPDQTSLNQLATTILHEALHNTQKHRQRLFEKRGLNAKLCNFAADLEINSNIAQGVCGITLSRPCSPRNGHWEWLIGDFKELDAESAKKLNEATDFQGSKIYEDELMPEDWFYQGILLPSYSQFSSFPTNGTAEQYLGMLEVEIEDLTLDDFMARLGGEEDNGAGSGNGGAEGNSGSGGSTNGGSGASSNGSNSDGYGGEIHDTGDGHVAVTHIYRKNADGSRTEVGKDSIVDDLGKHADDEVWDAASRLGINPISRSEEQKVRDQIAHDIDTYRRSNGYGTGAGGMLLNYIEQGLRPPIVDWKKMLRHVMTRACQEQTKGRSDYTYRRPNRRYSQGEFIFPGMVSYVPTVRFALDTSGSMSAREYFNALSEVDGILKLSKASIEFCCWDGEVSEVSKVKSISEIKESLVGSGGTVPAVIARAIAEEKEKDRPDVLVIATDGCFDWQNFAVSLREPAMDHIIPIVIVVYPFSEEAYWEKQGTLKDREALLRQYHRKAQVLQAWAKTRN